VWVADRHDELTDTKLLRVAEHRGMKRVVARPQHS
jgi:hypothetical protein